MSSQKETLKRIAQFKDSGNQHFSKGEYEEALKYYTQAIDELQKVQQEANEKQETEGKKEVNGNKSKEDSSESEDESKRKKKNTKAAPAAATQDNSASAVLYSNRCATYIFLKRNNEAVEDAVKCIEAKPDWPKGYYRLGSSLLLQSKYPEAVQAFHKGLMLQPVNKELQEKLAEVRKIRSPLWRKEEIDVRELFADPLTKPVVDYLRLVCELYIPKRHSKIVTDSARIRGYLAATREAMQQAFKTRAALQPSRTSQLPSGGTVTTTTIDKIPPVHMVFVGSGTGILPLLALKEGRSKVRVTAIEKWKHLASINGTVMKLHDNYFDEYKKQLSIVNANPAEVKLSTAADILVLENIDQGLFGDGLVQNLHHLRRTGVITEATKIIPGKATLYAMLIDYRTKSFEGVNLEPFNIYRWSTHYLSLDLAEQSFSAMSDPVRLLTMDFYSPPEQGAVFNAMFRTKKAGVVNAVAFWFDLEIDSKNRGTTGGIKSEVRTRFSSWQQAVQYMDTEKKLEEGFPVAVTARIDPNGLRFMWEKAQPRSPFWLSEKSAVPAWHFSMLADTNRNQAYEKAIRKLIELKKDQPPLVLDIGTGTGLLAMLAAKTNLSAKIVGCEANPHLALVGQESVTLNELDSAVTVVASHSRNIRVGSELPELADVLISEIVDHGLLSEGVIPTVKHAQEHLLKPAAKMIPKGAVVYCCAVDVNRVGEAEGLDFSVLNALYLHHYDSLPLKKSSIMTETAQVFSFNFYQSSSVQSETKDMLLKVTKSGTINGVAMWFNLQLDDEISISTRPGSDFTAWHQAVQYFNQEVRVKEGMNIPITASHDTLSITFQLNNAKLFENRIYNQGNPIQPKGYDQILAAERNMQKDMKEITEEIRNRGRLDPVVWNVLNTIASNAVTLHLDPEIVSDFINQIRM